MLRNVFLKTLRDRRRAIAGWSVGLVAMTVFSVALYPSVKENAADLAKLTESLPKEILALVGGDIDFASGAGFLHSRFFAFLGPLLLIVFTIGFGARTIAGEEQAGTLELVLATPVPRRSIVAQKLGGMLAAMTTLGVVLWAAFALGSEAWDVGVTAGRIGAAVLSAVLLALTFGTIALLVGSATGKRAFASTAATVTAVVTYLMNAYASLVDALKPWRYASPWYYYDSANILRGVIEPGNLVVLVGLVAVFSSIALVVFDRRDVGV
ncbi:MAG: ABC transporter permease subunit [Actinomycetota bacterium]